jgi:GNAT superfamily N-acetyltransferase
MQQGEQYRISMDLDELQLEVIHGYLTTSYWSPGVPLELVARAIQNSLVVGAYTSAGVQVGFARLVTDYARFGYLADVFVLEPHRGRGLAQRMVLALLAHPELKSLSLFMLATRDAHGVYLKCGFEALPNPDIFMQLRRPVQYRP